MDYAAEIAGLRLVVRELVTIVAEGSDAARGRIEAFAGQLETKIGDDVDPKWPAALANLRQTTGG